MTKKQQFGITIKAASHHSCKCLDSKKSMAGLLSLLISELGLSGFVTICPRSIMLVYFKSQLNVIQTSQERGRVISFLSKTTETKPLVNAFSCCAGNR